MAHSHANTRQSSGFSQDYFPLNSLPLAYNDSDLLKAQVSHSSHRSNSLGGTMDSNLNAYLADNDVLYHDASHTSTAIEPVPVARQSYSSSTRKLNTKRLVSNPFGGRNRFSLKDWRWEFSGAALSLACFAAVVAVLVVYGDKALSSWNASFGITLNTVIATLSTLSKTALLVPVASCLSQLKWIHMVTTARDLDECQIFDDASRGPWGSLELIWKMHIKAKLAVWGSFITILALAMSPFAQQLLSYPSRSIESVGGVFYKSQTYDYAARSLSSLGVHQQASDMDPKMRGAILNGLFNLSSPVDITCPGNCHWEQFTTLAVTSACENVSTTSDRRCETSETAIICNYTTPLGLKVTGKRFFDSAGEGGTPFASAARSGGSTSLSQSETLPDSTIARIAIATMDDPYDVDRPNIVDCQMNLVAQTIRNLTVTNGTFSPGVSEDLPLRGVRIDSIRSTGTFYRNGTGYPYPLYVYAMAGDSASYTGNSTFNITRTDFGNIQRFISNIFNIDNRVQTDMSQLMYMPLFNSSDRVETLRAMARGITYEIGRSSAGTKIAGVVTESESYIKVNWPWIILPLLEVVMGIAFMVCTLHYNHRTGVTVWKSSNVVPLLTIMAGWEDDEQRLSALKALEEKSRRMKGWRVPSGGSVKGLYRTGQ